METPSEEVDVFWVSQSDDNAFIVQVFADMNTMNKSLGSYKLDIEWNPDEYAFVEFDKNRSYKSEQILCNDTQVGEGEITIVSVHPDGQTGLLNLANLKFIRLNSNSLGDILIQPSNFASTKDFQILTPVVRASKSFSDLLPASKIQVYPNPFDQQLMIDYYLPSDGDVKFSIYDIGGQFIAELENGKRQAGQHKISWQAPVGHIRDGIYLIKAQLGDELHVRRVVSARN